ncbi:MAG: DMT family transporter [Bacteroidetes bacterium]|nr:DMT family transporter [Bacteroidota bacterium]
MNPYIILVIQLFFSSCTYIIANAATQTIPPANLTFMRTLISGVVYLSYMFYAGLPFNYKGRDLYLLLILGFLSVPINQFAFLYGIKYATATEAALLYSVTPVLVLLISRVYLKEKITLTKAIGTLMAFCGVVVIVMENGTHFGVSHMMGDLLVFTAVIAWTLYITLGRRLVLKHGAINTTAFTALIGSSMFAPIGIWSSFKFNYFSLSGGQWMEVLYLSLITSMVGYVLWYSALSKIEASRVAVFTNGQPVMTAILAYIFLGQGITPTFALGALVTIGGVIITQLDLQRRR